MEVCCRRSANDSYLLCKWRRGEARKPFSILISTKTWGKHCHISYPSPFCRLMLHKNAIWYTPRNRAGENAESARSAIHAIYSAYCAYFYVLRQKLPYFNILRQKVSYFNVARRNRVVFDCFATKQCCPAHSGSRWFALRLSLAASGSLGLSSAL